PGPTGARSRNRMRSRLFASTIIVAFQVSFACSAFAVLGALTQLPGTDGCISKDGTAGECAPGRGLDGALDVAISPDGGGVYVASFSSGAVATLVRNRSTAAGPIGRLTQPADE